MEGAGAIAAADVAGFSETSFVSFSVCVQIAWLFIYNAAAEFPVD
jgi:hypothetical protein